MADMSQNGVSFRMFHDQAMAAEVARILSLSGIPSEVVRSKQYFDPSFAFNKVDPDISLMLEPADFTRATQALKQFYQQRAEDTDRGYYLFSFTDQELIELVRKPDEWGEFDVVLARRILHERGIEISDEVGSQVERERIEMLKQPEKADTGLVLLGYLGAVAGGFVGIIIGWLLMHSKKTIPNGDRVHVYGVKDRKHGLWITAIATAVFFFVVSRALLISFLNHG
jgi:hypothetical protein